MSRLYFRFFCTGLGNLKGHQRCSLWRGNCLRCTKPLRWPTGIFCGFFCWKLGRFPACQAAWCGGCYTLVDTLCFHFHWEQTTRNHTEASENNVERLERVTAWKSKKQHLEDYKEGRNGDSLMTPFECDVCIFRKLKGREFNLKNSKDTLLLDLIRRANLDAFWARARSTVYQNLTKTKRMLEFSEMVGLNGPFISRCPFPPGDHCGYELAISTLLYSRRPRKHLSSHTQHDTIRKLKSAYGNWLRSSSKANQVHYVMCDDGGKVIRITNDLSSSLWYHCFNTGMKYQMGTI